MRHSTAQAVLSAALTVSLAMPAWAESPVLSTQSDPRIVSMGGAGVALGASILSSDANPALLALASSAHLQALGPVTKGFHEDSQLWQIGAMWPLSPDRPYVPAAGVTYREFELSTEFLVRTAFEPEGSAAVFAAKTRLTSLVLAMPVGDIVALGGALRYADVRDVTGWYGDAGLVAGGELGRGERFRVDGTVAVAVRQMGDDVQGVTDAINSSGPDVFERVRIVAAPVTARMAWGGTLRVTSEMLAATLALELVDPLEAGTSGKLYEHAGLELDYRNRVALRAGVVDDDAFETKFTYGAGVRIPFASRVGVALDYAREPALEVTSLGMIDDHAPKASHYFGLRLEYFLR